MERIHRVAIFGAGAMGGFLASRFCDAPVFTTELIAGGHYHERLTREGLVVNGKLYRPDVVHPDEEGQAADLIIVALKHHQLRDGIHDLKNKVGGRTTIISVMNGLESEEFIGSVYGLDRLLYTISVGIDAVREENRITYTKPGVLYFGELRNPTPTAKVRRVEDAFKAAAIPCEVPEDMKRMLWWKLMVNAGINQASAVLGAPYGVFHSSQDARDLMEALMREVIELAGAVGVNLVERDLDQWYGFLRQLSPQGKSSMLQDIEAHRKTEVEIFSGNICELGAKHDVPTPVNRTVLQIIKVLEG
ncbi:MAG: ketopantoate reductase family protein [Spirochaetaceae bacterium]|nr:MAG: ketopantoate reductase family protein [Spirochaetaceae bacterium]